MEALVSLVVGAVAVWVGWRRLKFVGAYWKRHQQVKQFEQALRDARASADGPNPFRVATAADAPYLQRLGLVISQEAALVEAGFRVLGELVGERAGKPFMISRMLVASDGMTTAMLGVSTTTSGCYLDLSSYDGDRYRSSVLGEPPGLACPPFVAVENMPVAMSIANLVAAHRPPEGARMVSSLDDVIAQLTEVHERTQAWRATQPPDELLDADLRMLLGRGYTHGGKRWAARLRSKLPQATARRV